MDNLRTKKQLFNSSIARCILIIVSAFLSISTSYSQSAYPFEKIAALSGQSNIVAVNSIIPPIVVRQASKGATSIENVSGQDYILDYIPNANATGNDTVVYEYKRVVNGATLPFFGSIIFRISKVKAKDDAYFFDAQLPEYTVPVLQNDLSQNTLNIKAISAISGGSAQISSDRQSLIFSPGTFGYFSIQYIAGDNFGNSCSAYAHMYISGGNAELFDTIQISTSKNTPINTGLPFDGFITSDSPQNGSLSLSSNSVGYIPSLNFVGEDVYELTKTFAGGIIHRVFVVKILDNAVKTMLVDDRYFISQNNQNGIYMNVFKNDILIRYRISSFTQTANGQLQYQGNDAFTYIPNIGFKGVDKFTYTVCSPTGCETANVFINVDNSQPENSDYYLNTAANQPIIINYALPFANYSFSVIRNPSNGTAVYYPGFNSVFLFGQWISGYNLLIYTPGSGFIGEDRFEIKYCVGTECKQVKIAVGVLDLIHANPCFQNCVWEGDANNDGKVNMVDLLTIGSHIGETGPVRQINNNGTWLGQSANNWNFSQASGQNLKYSDCNGDGVISVSDTTGISNFYYKNHTLTNNIIGLPTTFPVYLVPRASQYNVGDLITIDIVAGDANYPAHDLSGFTLSLDYNTNVLDSNSVCIMYDPNSWLINANNKLALSKSPWGGRIDGGVSRIDGKNASGFGKIGVLLGIIDDVVGGIGSTEQFKITIKSNLNSYAQSANGELISLPLISTDLFISNRKATSPEQLLVFPNPSDDIVNIRLNGLDNQIDSWILSDLKGSIISGKDNINTKNFTLNVNELPSGIYLLKVKSNQAFYTQKIIVNH